MIFPALVLAACAAAFPRPQKVANGDFGWTSGIAQPVVTADGRIVVWAQLDHFYKPWRLYGAFADDPARAAPLTAEDEAAYGPRLSADGRYVSYTGWRRGENGWGVCLQDLRTGARRRLCDGHAGGFSPDGTRLLYDRDGLLYERVLRADDFPAGGAAPRPVPEEKVLVSSPRVDARTRLPLPPACAFGTDGALFVRADVVWDGVGTNIQPLVRLEYAKSRSAVELYIWKGRPAFAVRSAKGRQLLTMARASAPTGTPFTVTGIRTANGHAVSVAGEDVRLSPFREGTLPLDGPVAAHLLENAAAPGGTWLKGFCVGRGWPREVHRIIDRAELFNGRSRKTKGEKEMER